jgi:hypothetical protein
LKNQEQEEQRAAVMPPENEDIAADDTPSRICEKCNAAMTQLGELPALLIHTAVRIFRCYACDHVASDQA